MTVHKSPTTSKDDYRRYG